MANTQTTVPKFSALEVLSANYQNLTAGTGCPVFATTVTRDAAFGGTGEKVLAEGQICYLESTNVVQVYDGANWQTVGPAPAAASALTLISTTTLSTSSTTFTNAFSSTYRNYLVLMNQIKFATSSGGLHLTLGAASSNYSYSQMYVVTSTAFNFGQGSSVNAYMYVADMDATNGVSLVTHILSPFETARTSVASEGLNYSSSPQWNKSFGAHTTATSFTSFTLASSTGTNLSGTVEVYGYGL